MNTELPAFLWLQEHPENLAFFNEHMQANRFGMPTFLDVFPAPDKASETSADRALFVDIGGGFGQQAISFREKYSQLEGRVIVQDLAPTTANATQHPGVEFMAYNFFTPQPVKGMASSNSHRLPCGIQSLTLEQERNSTICGISSTIGQITSAWRFCRILRMLWPQTPIF